MFWGEIPKFNLQIIIHHGHNNMNSAMREWKGALRNTMILPNSYEEKKFFTPPYHGDEGLLGIYIEQTLKETSTYERDNTTL